MIKQKGIAKTPREHFMRTAEDELAKFVRKELAFQQAERNERAAQLGLPLPHKEDLAPSERHHRK